MIHGIINQAMLLGKVESAEGVMMRGLGGKFHFPGRFCGVDSE
jgi:hypothetical protein